MSTITVTLTEAEAQALLPLPKQIDVETWNKRVPLAQSAQKKIKAALREREKAAA